MWTILGSIAAWLINFLIGKFFPGHPKITPEVVAQAQLDRGDILTSQKVARDEANQIRSNVGTSLNSNPVAGPGGVYAHDANERPSSAGDDLPGGGIK